MPNNPTDTRPAEIAANLETAIAATHGTGRQKPWMILDIEFLLTLAADHERKAVEREAEIARLQRLVKAAWDEAVESWVDSDLVGDNNGWECSNSRAALTPEAKP